MKFVKDTRDNSEKWVTEVEEKMNDFYKEVKSVKENVTTIIKNAGKIVDDVQETINEIIEEDKEPKEEPKEDKSKKRTRKK